MKYLMMPWVCAALLLAQVEAPLHPLAADELRLPPGQYAYVVIDRDLRDVLTEFGRNLNVVVKLSDDVQGRVHGPLPVSTAQEFLERLCETYGLVSYYDGAVLHVNAASELRTELMDVGALRTDEVSSKLRQISAGGSPFHLDFTPDSRVISVSGSPPYLARVKEMLTVLSRVRTREVKDDVRVRVFRGGT